MNLFKNAKQSIAKEKEILFSLNAELEKAEACGDESYIRRLKRERGFSNLLIDLLEVEIKEQEILAANNSQLNRLQAEL